MFDDVIKIAICDDDIDFIQYLKKILLLSGLKKYAVVFYEYLSGEDFLDSLDNEVIYDLVVLDMQMKGLDGFETASIFRRKYQDITLVFCSGIERANERTLEVEPYRYLLKRYNEERMIRESKQIIKKIIKEKEELEIPVKCDGGRLKLSIKEVYYIEKAKRGCRIYLGKHNVKNELGLKFIHELKLEQIYEQLKGFHFSRPHDSYIVNMRHINISKSTKSLLELTDGTQLAISRSKEKGFRDNLTIFLATKY